MSREPARGPWLTSLLADHLGFSGEALRILADAEGPAVKWLFVRRALEYDLDTGPADTVSERTYREAADALRQLGQADEASAMDAIADTSDVLECASIEWHERYAGRPATAADRAAIELLADGRIWPHPDGEVRGIDGVLYTGASLAQPNGVSDPAVVVTTNAGTSEIVAGFRDTDDMQAWLADRQLGTQVPGLQAEDQCVPLAGCVTGPSCRTQEEERVLAWLLRADGVSPHDVRGLQPYGFSAHSRAEIYLAWRESASGGAAPSPVHIRHELAKRLLHTPQWGARYVGWPFGELGLAYFDRLAVTPVTAQQGRAALYHLVQQDITRAGPVGRSLGASRTRAAGPLLGWIVDPQNRKSPLKRPDDPSPGPVPRR